MMVAFIARMIEEAADVDTAKGKAKYKAYFVKTAAYLKYKDEVDTILEVDGYGEVIA